MARRDTVTQDMFAVPVPANESAACGFGVQVANLVSEVLRHSEYDRHEVAARMTRYSGKEVSKYMLDAWSAESRDSFNIPLYLVPALEYAAGTSVHNLTNWLAVVRGGRLLVGRETLEAELGKAERERETAAKRIKELKQRLGEKEQ